MDDPRRPPGAPTRRRGPLPAVAPLALAVLAVAGLATCVQYVPRDQPLPFAGADVAPAVGGELRLVRPAGGDPLGPVIGFPLRHTEVHTRVVGALAVSTVEQTFENPLTHPTDAVYVFPLGDRAAVSAYRITIGARTIEGTIQKRAQARATYDAARAAGHTAALLEQVKANVFSQRIANLAAGETITVRFEVSEPLAVRDGQLELVFPLTVGPRYLPATRRGASPVSARQAGDLPAADETSIGYVDAAIAGNTVGFTAEVDLPLAPAAVSSPSHDLDVTATSPGRTTIRLAHADELPNRDLVVRLRVGDLQTLVTAAAHRRGDDGYALVTIAPRAAWSRAELTPRDVVILLDTSGSMADGGLDQGRTVAHAIVDALQPGDTVDVIAFADHLDRLPDGPLAIDGDGGELVRLDAHRFLDRLTAGGGTPIERGVLTALDEPVSPGRLRMVYLLSDGLVGHDDVVVEAARGALGANRIYPVGIGAAPNRYLIDELARVGRGFASYLGPTESAPALAREVVARSRAPYLTDVTIDWGGLAIDDQAPALVPDVHAGLPLGVAVRYRQPGTATVTVRGLLAGRPVSYPATVTLPADADQPAVRLAWARARVDDLLAGEEGPRDSGPVSAAIERLGLEHGLVTRETSFVAVDRTRVVAPGGAPQVLEAPATMPEGVDLEQVVPSPPPPVKRGAKVGTAREVGYPRTGGRGGGGDVDPLTLVLAAGLAPALAWLGRRRRSSLAGLLAGAPWTLALAATALAATTAHLVLGGDVVAPLTAHRDHLAQGPWRLVTGPLVHGTWGHLVRDLALVVGLGVAAEAALGRRYPALVLVGLVVPAAATLASGASLYFGLSGLSHALLAAITVLAVDHARGRARAAAVAVGALLTAKVGLELVTGLPVFPMALGPGVTTATVAHALGAAVGAMFVFVHVIARDHAEAATARGIIAA